MNSNGTATKPSVTRRAAEYYVTIGWVPVPIPHRCKAPRLDAWQKLTADRVRVEIDTLFPTNGDGNVGLLLGKPLDADLDAPEAVVAGNILLPPTTWIFGRAGKPKSHHLYEVEGDVPPTTKYQDLDRTMLVELRSVGCQTVVPPSVHPSGEPVVWHQRDGRPALLSAGELRKAVAVVAAAALIARHWPGIGGRHDASLALSGGLLRAGWEVERVRDLMTAVVQAAGDEELSDRLAAVDSTDDRLKDGGEVTGWPKLAEALGDKGEQVVAKVRSWLGIGGGRFTFGGHTAASGEQVEGHTLGPLTLKPSKPRQTPSGKLTVPVRVYKDGKPIDQVVLTSTPNGRKEASRLLQAKAPDVAAEEVDRVIEAIISESLGRLDGSADQPKDGATLREVIGVYVRQHYRPTRRIGRRVWLAELGQDFDRSSFLHLVNSDLLRVCRAASDVAEGEDDYQLLAKVEACLRVVFGDLLTTLAVERPDEDTFHPGEREGLAMAVIGMWTVVKSLSKTKGKDGEERTVNVSLIEQAKGLVSDKRLPVNQWVKIHPAHPAFICRHERTTADGEVVEEVLLGMNAELANSTGVRLPDGFTNFNLKKSGKRADLFREVEGVTSKAERSNTRVIVLSQKLTAYLLEDISGTVLSAADCPHSAETVRETDAGHEVRDAAFEDSCSQEDSY